MTNNTISQDYGDGIVNILDLILAASDLGSTGEFPTLFAHKNSGLLTHENLKKWIKETHEMNLNDPVLLQGLPELDRIGVILYMYHMLPDCGVFGSRVLRVEATLQ